MSSIAGLTIYDTDSEHWTKDCEASLCRRGAVVQHIGASALRLWWLSELKPINEKLRYTDGVDLGTVWLRPGRVAVRLSPRRLYFSGNDAQNPLKERESVILAGSPRPRNSAEAVLKATKTVGDILEAECVLSPCRIDASRSETGLLKYTLALGRRCSSFDLTQDLWRGLRQSGVHSVPENFKIIAVHDKREPLTTVNAYLDNLVREWLPELGIVDARSRLSKTNLSSALARLKEVSLDQSPAGLDGAIFLVAISGRPGDPLPPEQEQVLRLLDSLRIPYRVFSNANTEAKWSSRSQAVSIIRGAGGVPYKLSLPLPDTLGACLFYGVDIGHDHRLNRVSRVVVSVTDQHGLLLSSLWTQQTLNEAALGNVLGAMLVEARKRAIAMTGNTISSSIVLRDGRIPPNRSGSGAENLGTYLNALGVDTTVIECRKRGNPLMYLNDGRRLFPAPAGTACAPEDADVEFVCTHDSAQGLPQLLKLHIPRGGNGHGLSLQTAARILTGLCYSPSLGLRPHLPGPIYWADGIGATNEHCYKFAGQPSCEFRLSA
jgi:hypothetical protein